MLYRIIIAAETVGSTGVSTLSIAQILGISERNNRRDAITSCMTFHQGFMMQVIEGARADVDRLLRRLGEDRRLRNLKVLVDRPVAQRVFDEPVSLCNDPRLVLKAVGRPCLSQLGAYEAERVLELRQAA